MAEGAMDGLPTSVPPSSVRPVSITGSSTDVAASKPKGPGQATSMFGGMTFHDILHGLNPLQHLPVVGMIYRAITGDQIEPGYRIGGSIISGFITGGPFGAVGSAVGSVLGMAAEDLFHKVMHAINTPAAPHGAASIAVPSAGSSPAIGDPASFTAGQITGGSDVQMSQAIAAYARTQAAALAGGWQPAQENTYAAACAG